MRFFPKKIRFFFGIQLPPTTCPSFSFRRHFFIDRCLFLWQKSMHPSSWFLVLSNLCPSTTSIRHDSWFVQSLSVDCFHDKESFSLLVNVLDYYFPLEFMRFSFSKRFAFGIQLPPTTCSSSFSSARFFLQEWFIFFSPKISFWVTEVFFFWFATMRGSLSCDVFVSRYHATVRALCDSPRSSQPHQPLGCRKCFFFPLICYHAMFWSWFPFWSTPKVHIFLSWPMCFL